ncbi:Mediator of RNA polymerase II transcription subunit 22 [Mortierella sp. GBA35]|nr:Mediator of RNA polymerase II transcription subunit 22 [Mortierella sp. AD031]KAF9093817.1 Mediator of RNA polymerase II transcription subunit 22 [Mortierella sp. GBA35]KAG0202289.1 Mediator of RNA polymerase II transcription subunit 22 [Mortierella sp. NVP41]
MAAYRPMGAGGPTGGPGASMPGGVGGVGGAGGAGPNAGAGSPITGGGGVATSVAGAGAGGVGGAGAGAGGTTRNTNLSALQEIEEAYNKRLDSDVAVLMESFGDIIKVASITHNESSVSKDKYKLAQESYQIQGRATNIVSSAESLLAMVTELKQTLLLNDTTTLAQLSTQRQAELSNQKTAVKQRVLGLKEEVDKTIWELEQACYGSSVAASSSDV